MVVQAEGRNDDPTVFNSNNQEKHETSTCHNDLELVDSLGDLDSLKYTVEYQETLLHNLLDKLESRRDVESQIRSIRVALRACSVVALAAKTLDQQQAKGVVKTERKGLGYFDMYQRQKQKRIVEPVLQKARNVSSYLKSPMEEEDLCPPAETPDPPAPTVEKKPRARRRCIRSLGPVGKTVVLHNGCSGIVRFAGCTQFASGAWLGVELSEPQGKHTGTYQGSVPMTYEKETTY